MAVTASDFPLQCIVCPRKPSFSDVSHLLTHVASKGHLSQYYKLKIRSSHDSNAMDVIEAFDSWYVNYNIEQLMSERMHLKDRKRTRFRAITNQDLRHRISAETRRLTVPSSIPTSFPIVGSRSTSSNFPYPTAPTATAKLYSPRLYLWSTIRPKSFNTRDAEPLHSQAEASRDVCPIAPVAKMWADGPAESIFEDDDDEIGGEMTRLKGVFWPGMDIFDAATPDMKRKRNQKKDTSVAVQLERHSLLAQPTEMIFTPFGSWRKSRIISGQPDFNSSPDRISPPVCKPRRRRTTTRLPLSKKDANIASLPSNQGSPSPSPFPGYGRATNQPRTATGSTVKDDPDAEANAAEPLYPSVISGAMRYLTASLHMPQHSGLEGRSLPPSTLLDINTGALYHNNFFAEAFESYHPTLVGLPYYGIGYYGQNVQSPSGPYAHSATNLYGDHEPANNFVPDNDSTNGECTISAKSEG